MSNYGEKYERLCEKRPELRATHCDWKLTYKPEDWWWCLDDIERFCDTVGAEALITAKMLEGLPPSHGIRKLATGCGNCLYHIDDSSTYREGHPTIIDALFAFYEENK